MPDYIGELGVGGIFAILLLQTVLPYLKGRFNDAPQQDGDCDKAEATLNEIAKSTQTMATILEKTDSDGLPLCYTPRSLTSAIESLSLGIEKLGDKVERIG